MIWRDKFNHAALMAAPIARLHTFSDLHCLCYTMGRRQPESGAANSYNNFPSASLGSSRGFPFRPGAALDSTDAGNASELKRRLQAGG